MGLLERSAPLHRLSERLDTVAGRHRQRDRRPAVPVAKTVNHPGSAILGKLDARNRTGATAAAGRIGIA